MNGHVVGMVLCALATGIGALPVLFFRRISHRRMDILLAYTAGVMVAASTYGLIPASLKLTNLYVLFFSVLIGALLLSLLEQFVPHVDLQHERMGVTLPKESLTLVMAMAFHNVPEGLSVGASFASGSDNLGVIVSLSIGLQNAPEGFLVALFLVNQGVSRRIALLVATLTGLIEMSAAFLGYHLASFAVSLVPYGLAFAAGAMLFIVYKELIPETHGHGYERSATFAFIIGLLSMIGVVEWFR
ncbi:ZIP family metal transporter [Paenibacillus paeoniae]|uniref:ZIP family metal transporter n=1 Tax=Paenibacillus paeoniae TaxID=2292705 RepID=A0A371PGB0_9BACL|nr:ZIP family metal transporter [Paenibacillus paeoniae]REK74588.1 ZIP family metal transporter [Paenibacillus paeoniae]